MSTPRRRPASGPAADGDGAAKRPTKAERRQQLLGVAATLFVERGYHAPLVEDIAAAAGVTPTQLARHFPDKPAILAGLCADLAATLAPADIGGASADALERLTALLDLWRASLPPAFRLVLGLLAADDAETRPPLAIFLAALAGRVETLLRDGQRAGLFRRTLDPTRAADELIRAMLGMALAGGNPTADCLLYGLLKTDV